jgi:hypothetical protein
MGALPVYCSVGFLNSMYERINQPISKWVEDDNIGSIQKLYKLIHHKAKVVLDKDISVFFDTESTSYNPNFKKLIKSGKLPKISPEDFKSINQKDSDFFNNKLPATAIIFTDLGKDDTNAIELLYGVMAFSSEEITTAGFIFCSGLELLVRNQRQDWSFIRKYKHPFNSLILSDAYILSTQDSRNNLKIMLQNILPEELSITFDLTIISDRNDRGLPGNLNVVYDELTSFLKQQFSYEINLNLVISPIHDRNFVTNYLFCSSGYGFELIRNGLACRDTHLSIFSIGYSPDSFLGYKGDRLSNELKLTGINIIDSLKKQYTRAATNTTAQMGLMVNVVGSKKNRLLD